MRAFSADRHFREQASAAIGMSDLHRILPAGLVLAGTSPIVVRIYWLQVWAKAHLRNGSELH